MCCWQERRRRTKNGCIGNQTGGRVFLFLHTDDFWRDYRAMTAKGVRFVREPRDEPYGTVAVFEDLYGNRWDLLQRKEVSLLGLRLRHGSSDPSTPS